MLYFRPHHFLCAIGFQGMGYSPKFVKNFKKIMDRLTGLDGDSQMIEVVSHTDIICSPCPRRRGKSCLDQSKISILDQAHKDALGLNDGDCLTWGEAKSRIASRVSLETFHNICASCQWKSLGVCEKALRDLKK